jgi:enoyl-CoA hydratase/carnithine racemase
MVEEHVRVELRSDGVAVVRLDRPKMNALSSVLLDQLASAAEGLAGHPPGAVVVWGGPRIFAAGADIAEFLDPDTARPSSSRARVVTAGFRRALDAVAAIPCPTLAAVDGFALGGGCELALACDLRVLSPKAKLGQPEILLGIIPGGGGTQRLARLIGPSRAKDLIFTGRQVGATEAMAIGLGDRLSSGDSAFEEALLWAQELARGARTALRTAKAALEGGAGTGLAEGLDLEANLFSEVFDTGDAATGVASFLAEGPGRARFSPS